MFHSGHGLHLAVGKPFQKSGVVIPDHEGKAERVTEPLAVSRRERSGLLERVGAGLYEDVILP